MAKAQRSRFDFHKGFYNILQTADPKNSAARAGCVRKEDPMDAGKHAKCNVT
jgi:hypothetical protein